MGAVAFYRFKSNPDFYLQSTGCQWSSPKECLCVKFWGEKETAVCVGSAKHLLQSYFNPC